MGYDFAMLFVCLGVAFATENRIVGGRPALEGEFPYQVSIRRSYNDKHFCGGSIITPKHVVTAAHCMYYKWGGVLPPYVVSVVVGQLDLPITPYSVYRNATDIVIHPGYSNAIMDNDIAVIEVNEDFPLETNPLVSVVPFRNESLSAGACLVSGWGVEEYESLNISEVLLVAQVDVVDVARCNDMYGPNVTLEKGMMCAGQVEGKADACQGDSGGPLLCDGFLTGIVSTGSGCGNPDFPGIYTDVAEYATWLRDVAAVVETRQEEPNDLGHVATDGAIVPAITDVIHDGNIGIRNYPATYSMVLIVALYLT